MLTSSVSNGRTAPLLAFVAVFLASLAPGQVAPRTDLTADLDAFDARTAQAPANTGSFLIPITIEAASLNGGDYLHIISSNPSAKISLLLPNSTEVNAANAVANGYAFTLATAADAQGFDTPSSLSLIGTHTLIQLATSAAGGTYNVKIDTTGIGTATDIAVLYFPGSQVRLGGLASGAVYTIGQPAVLSALLVNDTVAITSATVSASVKVERDVSAQVTIGNYQLIGQTTGADGYVQYKYSARATNNGAALTGVQGRGSYTGGSFYAGQIVSFGSITAGATASGLDTFTVALPSGVSFSTNALSWKATAVSTAVAVSMTDSGPNDAQVGDGIYTGTYTPSEAGKHIVALTASGSSNGAAFSRTASFEFEVISSAGSFGTFTSQGLDRNGDAVSTFPNYDAIEVTANVTVPQLGRYRLSIDLANTSPGVSGDEAQPINAAADVTLASAGTAQIKVVFPAGAAIMNATVLTLQNAMLHSLDSQDREKSLIAFRAVPGNIAVIPAANWERPFTIAASGHTATLLEQNGIAGADILRIGVAVSPGRLGPCNISGTLSTASGQIIQNLSGSYGTVGQIVSSVNFDFAGSLIARTGVAGPYTLSYASIRCSGVSAQKYGIFQTPAYALSQFPSVQDSLPTFGVSLPRNSIMIAPTGQGTFDVVISPVNGFSDTITPSIAGLPVGVQAQFMPLPQWFPSKKSVQLTTTNAAIGTYPLTLTFVSGSINRTANLTLAINTTGIPVVITSNPTARSISVDGSIGVGTQSFGWTVGQAHAISVPSPQVDGFGVKWVFDRWSDGGAKDRNLSTNTSLNLTGTMIQEWTESVQVIASQPVYDGNLKFWTRVVTIQNTGSATIMGPVYLGIVSTSPSVVHIRNDERIPIAGLRAIKSGSGAGIAPGATITGLIAYIPDGDPQFSFTSRVFAGTPSYEIGAGGSIAVTISPQTASLTGSQARQFTTTVTGSSNSAVNWSLTPASGAGSISTSVKARSGRQRSNLCELPRYRKDLWSRSIVISCDEQRNVAARDGIRRGNGELC